MTARRSTGPHRRPERRAWLKRLIVASSLALAAGLAQAQAWPAKPVRIIVPAAPGGSADPLARLLSEELGRTFGQTLSLIHI